MKKTLPAVLAALALLALCFPAAGTDNAFTPEEALSYFYQIGAQLKSLGLYPFAPVGPDDRGYEVYSLQSRLYDLHYYGLALDGIYGRGTRAAVELFEAVNGLKRDGLASAEDQRLLFSESALANYGTIVIVTPEREDGRTPGPGEEPTATALSIQTPAAHSTFRPHTEAPVPNTKAPRTPTPAPTFGGLILELGPLFTPAPTFGGLILELGPLFTLSP